MTFSLQESSVSQCYADAINVEHSASDVTGIIPAYTIWDVSSQIRITTWFAVEIKSTTSSIGDISPGEQEATLVPVSFLLMDVLRPVDYGFCSEFFWR